MFYLHSPTRVTELFSPLFFRVTSTWWKGGAPAVGAGFSPKFNSHSSQSSPVVQREVLRVPGPLSMLPACLSQREQPSLGETPRLEAVGTGS